MNYRPRRKRSIYTSPENKIKAVERVLAEHIPTRQMSEEMNVSQTIVDYAVNQTNLHLILCNSNRSRKGRLDLLAHFHNKGFISILVNFDIPDDVLLERVAKSQRSTTVFRIASTFEEVLIRQQAESHKSDVTAPIEGEANHLFVIKNTDEAYSVTRKIVNIAQNL